MMNGPPRDYFKTAGKNESWWMCQNCGHEEYHIVKGRVPGGQCGGCGYHPEWARFIPGEVVLTNEELDVLVFNGVLDANW